MNLNEIISPERVQCSLSTTSKKRLLEQISELLHSDEPGLDEYEAFQSLIERERLGSTGIGHGVALPHGRLKGLKRAIAAFATLDHGIDYDAIDNEPIRMVFALLVPENAEAEHLEILAQVARLFNDEQVRGHLMEAHNREELYQYLTSRANG